MEAICPFNGYSFPVEMKALLTLGLKVKMKLLQSRGNQTASRTIDDRSQSILPPTLRTLHSSDKFKLPLPSNATAPQWEQKAHHRIGFLISSKGMVAHKQHAKTLNVA